MEDIRLHLIDLLSEVSIFPSKDLLISILSNKCIETQCEELPNSEALQSILKALKPGGKLVILEFSKPQNEVFREIYDLFSFEVIPKIGELIAQTEESYRYLAESIRMHPTQEELKEMLEKSGFTKCKYGNLTNGIVAIHSGQKEMIDA